jgi:hypothetical protein
MTKISNYINHIVFVIDRSGSMAGISKEVIEVFDVQIANLAQRSKELDQETRVSVYLFNGSVECIVYDKDVLRLPSLKDLYMAGGSTNLLEATIKSIDDLAKTPELYGDHAFLLYVLTDGQNTDNNHLSTDLAQKIKKLPDNWTLAVLVPDQNGVFEAKRFGFPANNISVWAADKKGVREVGEVITKTTNAYMQARSVGVRGTKNLFDLGANANITKTAVKTKLDVLPAAEYETLLVRQYDDGKAIKDFVEAWTKNAYRMGSAYFQLTKPEKIQPNKNIIIREKLSAKAYTGDNARTLLGLPDYEVKVSPASFKDYDIFVQSNSVNRKLVKDTHLIVLK